MRTSTSASRGPRSLTCVRVPFFKITNRDGGPAYLASRIARGISGWLKYHNAPDRRRRRPPPIRSFLMRATSYRSHPGIVQRVVPRNGSQGDTDDFAKSCKQLRGTPHERRSGISRYAHAQKTGGKHVVI